MSNNKNSKKPLRRCYFVDHDVQTALMKRVSTYWIASLLFLSLPIAFANTFLYPGTSFLDNLTNVFLLHWPVFLMMFLFLPFALNDAIRFSNRFVGPIYRLRTELRNFAISGKLKNIRFRKDDFWHDLADGMNEVSSRLNELEQAPLPARDDMTEDASEQERCVTSEA